MTWPQIEMPVLICEPSPEASSIQWPRFGISTSVDTKTTLWTWGGPC